MFSNATEAKAKTCPYNRKTVILLEHSSYFRTNCIPINSDLNLPSDNEPLDDQTSVPKTLWNCSVQAVMEYCRIVWDLFSGDKLIRCIVSDRIAQSLNSWSKSQQNIDQLVSGFAQIGSTSHSIQQCYKFSIFPGIVAAAQAMGECSEKQYEKKKSLNTDITNRCRVICITAFTSNETGKMIEEKLHQCILDENKATDTSDLQISVNECDLVILNIDPNNSTLENIPKHKVSSFLESEIFNVKIDAVDALGKKLTSLVMTHYNLASTVITGIPMKIEQENDASTVYDVEVYHSAKAYDTLFNSSLNVPDLISWKEDHDYATINLKCTNSVLANFTTFVAVHRITPADKNSHQYVGLIKFLLNGKTLMLEVDCKKDGNNIISHMLTGRNGILYMHSTSIGRSSGDTAPSTSDSIGAIVSDYPINDFAAFTQMNKLEHPKSDETEKSSLNKHKRSKVRMERHTKLSSTSVPVCNYKKYLNPLLTLMLESELKESDVIDCKQFIYLLFRKQARHVHESESSTGENCKYLRIDEQNKQILTELEVFLRSKTTNGKQIDILNYFLEVKTKYLSMVDDNVEMDRALRELEELRSEFEISNTESISTAHVGAVGSSIQKTVLEYWIEKCKNYKSRSEFVGFSKSQMASNNSLKYDLYSKLKFNTIRNKSSKLRNN